MKGMTKKAYLALLSLAIAAFAIGTTEFVIVGLLPTVAVDLNITVVEAGKLITGYALALAVGTPLVVVLTGKVVKKNLLLLLLLVFTLGNGVAAIASNYEVLMLSRVITAISHGVFFSVATIVATDIVPNEKRGSAISIMFSGLTVATIAGVPIGTMIGQQFGWRMTFATVAFLGLIGLIATWLSIEPSSNNDKAPTIRDIKQLLSHPRIMLALSMTIFGFGATFSIFTYLAPILEQISGFSPQVISYLLLLYGVAVAIGNVVGGKLANQAPVNSLKRIFLLQGIVLLVQYWLLPLKVVSIFSIMILGLFAFMMSPGVQVNVVNMAEKYVPTAKNVASALNISAFNIGIALGSFLGSIAVDTLSYLDTAWVGALMAFLASLIAYVNIRLDQKRINGVINK